MNERLLNPVSDAELDSRWTAVRKVMADGGVDAIVAQSNNDWLGGHAKWLTETRTAIGQLMIDNLTAHFAGRKLPTPVT